MKIERPDWSHNSLINAHQFLKWFDTHVEPINKILSEGVKVKSDKLQMTWVTKGTDHYLEEFNTHKALLINIEKIEKKCPTCGK